MTIEKILSLAKEQALQNWYQYHVELEQMPQSKIKQHREHQAWQDLQDIEDIVSQWQNSNTQ